MRVCVVRLLDDIGHSAEATPGLSTVARDLAPTSALDDPVGARRPRAFVILRRTVAAATTCSAGVLHGTEGGSRCRTASVDARGRRVAARVLAHSLLPLLIRETLQRNRVTILVYHSPPEAAMLGHLRYLSSRYRVISLRRFVQARQRNELHSLPRKSLVITFDDGHRSNQRLTNLFRRLRIPATIFVCTGIVGTRRRFWFKHVPNAPELAAVPDDVRLDRLEAAGFAAEADHVEREALSRAEIEEMARETFDFQSHTISHPSLPSCPADKAEREIVESKRQLEDEYGFDVYALAYPNGDYSDRECALARAAGYACALTVDLGFNSDDTDLFRLKRISIDDGDGTDELAVKTCALWGLLKRLVHRQPYGYRYIESRG
jgi:peptidoglycan/xylan/chitin deacetylase (PgdA/CDA1 family)